MKIRDLSGEIWVAITEIAKEKLVSDEILIIIPKRNLI